MEGKMLSPWCKSAKIAMIQKDVTETELAKATGMARSYVCAVLNGRISTRPAVKKISDYLGIQDSDTTTVSY